MFRWRLLSPIGLLLGSLIGASCSGETFHSVGASDGTSGYGSPDGSVGAQGGASGETFVPAMDAAVHLADTGSEPEAAPSIADAAFGDAPSRDATTSRDGAREASKPATCQELHGLEFGGHCYVDATMAMPTQSEAIAACS